MCSTPWINAALRGPSRCCAPAACAAHCGDLATEQAAGGQGHVATGAPQLTASVGFQQVMGLPPNHPVVISDP